MNTTEAKGILGVNNILNSMEIWSKFDENVRSTSERNKRIEAKKCLFRNLVIHYKRQKKKFRPKLPFAVCKK